MTSKFDTRLLVRGLVMLVFCLPLLWMVGAALHPLGVPLPQTLRLLPEAPAFGNFARVWGLVPLGRFALNSLLVGAVAVPLTVLTGSWAGFAMANLPRASQRRWVLLSLAVLMVPAIALWMPRFLVYRQLGWLDSVWALVAPAWMGTSPFYVLMFYRAFRRIPAELYDAARLDGAGVLQSWARVAMPLAWPTIAGVALLSFVVYWGNVVDPMLYLRSERHYTLPVALRMLEQMSRPDWSLLMAASLFATLLPLAAFLALVVVLWRRSAGRV